jgi:hypothetical protein
MSLAAVLLVLFVHSLLYAGFFEDPLTWGVFGLAAAVLAFSAAPRTVPSAETPPESPALQAH